MNKHVFVQVPKSQFASDELDKFQVVALFFYRFSIYTFYLLTLMSLHSRVAC